MGKEAEVVGALADRKHQDSPPLSFLPSAFILFICGSIIQIPSGDIT
jgi:hypothetical protein